MSLNDFNIEWFQSYKLNGTFGNEINPISEPVYFTVSNFLSLTYGHHRGWLSAAFSMRARAGALALVPLAVQLAVPLARCAAGQLAVRLAVSQPARR